MVVSIYENPRNEKAKGYINSALSLNNFVIMIGIKVKWAPSVANIMQSQMPKLHSW